MVVENELAINLIFDRSRSPSFIDENRLTDNPDALQEFLDDRVSSFEIESDLDDLWASDRAASGEPEDEEDNQTATVLCSYKRRLILGADRLKE